MPTPTVTLEDVRDTQYDILREDQDDTSAYPPALMDSFTNLAQKKFCRGRIIHPITWEEARKWTLPFIQTQAVYSLVTHTTLSADEAVGSTVLNVTSAADFPSTWALYINGEIFVYASKTATSFTGATGILGAYTAGTRIDIAFALPSNYMSSLGLIYNHKAKLQYKKYDDIFEWANSFRGSTMSRANNQNRTSFDLPPFYSIKDGAYLLVRNIGQTGDQVLHRYEKPPTAMTLDASIITIDDDDYGKMFLAYRGVAEMLMNRQEEDSANKYFNIGIKYAREMYGMYNDQDGEKMSGRQVGMQKGTGRNF